MRRLVCVSDIQPLTQDRALAVRGADMTVRVFLPNCLFRNGMDTSRRSAVLAYILHEVARDRVWAISHRPFTRSCLQRLARHRQMRLSGKQKRCARNPDEFRNERCPQMALSRHSFALGRRLPLRGMQTSSSGTCLPDLCAPAVVLQDGVRNGPSRLLLLRHDP